MIVYGYLKPIPPEEINRVFGPGKEGLRHEENTTINQGVTNFNL